MITQNSVNRKAPNGEGEQNEAQILTLAIQKP